jgi:hypothetical protein
MKRMNADAAVRCVLAAAFLLPAQSALAASTRYGLEADVVYDDNASRGLGEYQKADTILAAEGFVARSLQLGARGGAVFRGSARYSQFFEFKDISNLTLSGRAAYRYQFGGGFSSPWIEAAAELLWLNHADSDLRDGSIVSIGASGGSHVTDRVRLGAGVGMDKRSGGDPGLYDLETNRLWATLDYRVGLRNTVYARLERVAGDHVFNTVTSTMGLPGLAGAKVWALDPALASGFGGRPLDAYQLEATTLLFELGLNYPLSGRQALDFSFLRFNSKADVGDYDGNQLRASYLHRF